MKRTILWLVCIALFFAARAENDVLHRPTLKVLDIGNSYSIDATAYLPELVKASGLTLDDMCLYICNRGGASFHSWCDIYNDKDSATTYMVDKVIGGLEANINKKWGSPKDGSLFRDVLTKEKWDLIIIHPLSTEAPYYETWNDPESECEGDLDSLLAIIRLHQPEATIGGMLIHSYASNYSKNKEKSSFTRWQLIARSIKMFCEDYNVDFIIPYGTAIQNLRCSSWNNEAELTRDRLHLDNGLARYTAACCFYEALLAPRYGVSVLGNPLRRSLPSPTDQPCVDVTELNAVIGQEAAVLAMRNMYHAQNPEEFLLLDTLDTTEQHSFHTLTYCVENHPYKLYDVAAGSLNHSPSRRATLSAGGANIPIRCQRTMLPSRGSS